MSQTEQTSGSSHETLDRVTIESQQGQLTTLTDELPYRTSGFHWQFVTEEPTKVSRTYGDTAVGTVDGDTVVRGAINDVTFDPRGLAEVFVVPPSGGQTKPTHWI